MKNVTIKNKSIILVSIFVLILFVNAITMINSSNNVKDINVKVGLETETTLNFLALKFIIKELQELSTDIALMGEREGLEEIKKAKEQYYSELKKLKLHLNTPQSIASNSDRVFDIPAIFVFIILSTETFIPSSISYILLIRKSKPTKAS